MTTDPDTLEILVTKQMVLYKSYGANSGLNETWIEGRTRTFSLGSSSVSTLVLARGVFAQMYAKPTLSEAGARLRDQLKAIPGLRETELRVFGFDLTFVAKIGYNGEWEKLTPEILTTLAIGLGFTKCEYTEDEALFERKSVNNEEVLRPLK